MAKVTVENAIVERVFYPQNGVGVAVYEEFEGRDKQVRKTRFTLWFKDDPKVEVGQRISASGFIGAKVRSYESGGETKYVADMSVNGARLIGSAPPIAPAPQEEPRPRDDWQF